MILDLFAGAGGAGLGLRRVFPDELIVHVDHDADCCATLRAALFPTDLDWVVQDEVGVGSVRVGPVTGLWASPPCQPYSHAGKRKGADDPRDAWPATLAVIEATRPQWVVIENVRGSPAERWADEIRKLNYTVATWDLDAADYGVPQHRRRRFVVALKLGPTSPFGGRLYIPPPPVRTHGPPEPAGFFPPRFKPFVTIRDALPHLREEGTFHGDHRPRSLPHVEAKPDWWHRSGPVTAPSRTIGGRGNACVNVVYPIGNGRAGSEPQRLDRPAVTVTAAEVRGTRASPSSGFDFHGGPDRASDGAFLATGRRRLTVEECAVLQGWPADWPFQGTKESRYRQVGNGCCPTLAEVVVRALLGRT